MSADLTPPPAEPAPLPPAPEVPAPMPTAAEMPAPRRNIFALFLGMLIGPRSTLTYLRDHGGASWLWPALLAIVILVANLVIIAPISQAAALKQVETQLAAMKQAVPDAQKQQMLQMVTNPLFVIVIPAVTATLTLVIGWLIRGGLYYLANLGLGGQGKFGAMFRMTVWVTLPDMVRQVVTTIGMAATGRMLKAGLGFLVPTPAGVTIPPMNIMLWQTFLSGLDLYWLWGLGLAVVGVAVTAQVSWRKGLVVAGAYWLLTVLLALGLVWASLTMAAQFGGLGG